MEILGEAGCKNLTMCLGVKMSHIDHDAQHFLGSVGSKLHNQQVAHFFTWMEEFHELHELDTCEFHALFCPSFTCF